MSDGSLRLQVIFSAIDKLTAPVRQLTQGSKALGRQVGETQKKLAGLKRQEAEIAGYRGAETRLQSTAAKLAEAKAKTEALRLEIAKVDQPTKRMAASLARAESVELRASAAHEGQGSRLQELARDLGRAGVAVDRLGDHEAELASRIRSTSRELGTQRERADRMARHRANGERLQGAGGRVAMAGAGLTAGVTVPFVLEMRAAIDAAKESAGATAQVTAAISSMGNKAGFTVDQLSAMAGKLQDLSLFDDDDIMAKVTANMLTFGKITGPVFDRAQTAVVDMATRLNIDLQGAALMVGKALDAPAKGMLALSRIGAVNKEWAAANKERIQGLIDSGHRDQAQILLLEQLEHQFKGSAAAARAASPDGQLQQNWRTFQETVGAVALRTLPPLLLAISRLLDGFNQLSPSTQVFIIGALALAAALGPIITIIGAIVSVVGGVAAVFSVGLLPAIGIVLAVVAAVALLAYGAFKIYQNWGAVSGFFVRLGESIVAAFFGLPGRFGAIGTAILQGLISAISPLALVQHILKLGSMAVSALKGVLGIHSPSRVFAAIGGHMMGGLALGLDRAAPEPMRRVHAAGVGLTRAMAGSLLVAAPTAARAAPIAATARAAPGPITIHIHQLPGQSADDLAKAVRRELAAHGRDQARDGRASYRDAD